MDRLKRLFIITLAVFGLAGCDSGNKDITPQEPVSQGTVNQGTQPADGNGSAMSPGSGGPMSGGPMAGGGMGNLSKPDDLMPIPKAQEAYDKASKAYGASKGDPKLKKAYVQATDKLADAHMWGDEETKVKYRSALKYYREALKADPTDAWAKNCVDTIVAIYQSLGRSVPGEGG